MIWKLPFLISLHAILRDVMICSRDTYWRIEGFVAQAQILWPTDTGYLLVGQTTAIDDDLRTTVP